MNQFQKNFLKGLIATAKQTGTIADAAYAADYMAQKSGIAYADCINALRKYGLRDAPRECKDRRGMFTAKNPGNDMLRVTWDRATISVETVRNPVSVSDLCDLGI